MITRIFSTHLFRILAAMLVIPMALGAISPVKASTSYTVAGWGWNVNGQADIPSDLTNVIAVAGGTFSSLALKSDGTVVGWGDNTYGQLNIPSDLTNVVAIASGAAHNLALKGDGTVVAWGSNGYGQLNIPSGLTDVIAIGAGQFHSLAVKRDGTVVAWGKNNNGEASIPSGLTGVVAVAGGSYTSLALKSDGTVVGWGDDYSGQPNVPSGLTDVIAIDAGAVHSLALKRDGTVVAWGNNTYGQLDIPSDLTGVVAIAAGAYHNLALKNDGTVVAWGSNLYGQTTIPSGLTGVAAISAGDHHSLALVPADMPINTAPTANPGGPYLGAVNTSIQFDGSLSSDQENDLLTYAWDFADGATGTGVAPTHSYTTAGVYNVCLTVNDSSLDSDSACTMAVVYDPSAGFVTGGGWITSPAGAYKADGTLAGQATFGFVSKYQKGASVPTGTTAFQFDLAGLAFSSTHYEWLVVNQAGTNAQFKGSGTLNGALDPNDQAYKFQLWANDGASTKSADSFRIKIWWEDASGEHVVYDNGIAQAVGGGNIVVRTGK